MNSCCQGWPCSPKSNTVIFVSYIFNSERTKELKVILSCHQWCRGRCPTSTQFSPSSRRTRDGSNVKPALRSISLDLGSVKSMCVVKLTFMHCHSPDPTGTIACSAVCGCNCCLLTYLGKCMSHWSVTKEWETESPQPAHHIHSWCRNSPTGMEWGKKIKWRNM